MVKISWLKYYILEGSAQLAYMRSSLTDYVKTFFSLFSLQTPNKAKHQVSFRIPTEISKSKSLVKLIHLKFFARILLTRIRPGLRGVSEAASYILTLKASEISELIRIGILPYKKRNRLHVLSSSRWGTQNN